MVYKSNLMETLKRNTIHIFENLVAAKLTGDEYTDTFTDIISGGLRGGLLQGEECREWVFAEYGGSTTLIGTRKYSERKGEKELTDASEIVFDNEGRIKGYKSGEIGAHPAKAYPDRLVETLGVLRGMTGGILPGKRGDIVEESKYIEDVSSLRKMGARIAFNYYANEKGKKLIGKDPFGRKIYTVKIPMRDNYFEFLDPREYDLGLMAKYVKHGTMYLLLSPFFKPVKEALKKVPVRIDPVVETHTEIAGELSEAGLGNLALALYPVMVGFKPVKEAVTGN